MTITDGAIMFGACMLSFAIGYGIGAFRVARYVTKRLDETRSAIEEIQMHSRELHQFYSKMGNGNEKP